MKHKDLISKLMCVHESLIGYREEWGTEKFLSIMGVYLIKECLRAGMGREGFNNYLAIMQTNFNECMTALKR